MKAKYFFASVFLLFIFIAFGSTRTFAQTQKLAVANLKGKDYLGCGCAFQTLAETKKSRSQKIVFWSEFDKKAILNINGKDTTFKLVKEGKRPAKQKIGSRFSDEYAAYGITVKVDYLTTRVCLKGDEECEATSYDVIITASKGNNKTIVKTKGACGC